MILIELKENETDVLVIVHRSFSAYRNNRGIIGKIRAELQLRLCEYEIYIIFGKYFSYSADEDSDFAVAKKWVEWFWNQPMRKGVRRYYDNCLYMFALLALSGNYRIY